MLLFIWSLTGCSVFFLATLTGSRVPSSACPLGELSILEGPVPMSLLRSFLWYSTPTPGRIQCSSTVGHLHLTITYRWAMSFLCPPLCPLLMGRSLSSNAPHTWGAQNIKGWVLSEGMGRRQKHRPQIKKREQISAFVCLWLAITLQLHFLTQFFCQFSEW